MHERYARHVLHQRSLSKACTVALCQQGPTLTVHGQVRSTPGLIGTKHANEFNRGK